MLTKLIIFSVARNARGFSGTVNLFNHVSMCHIPHRKINIASSFIARPLVFRRSYGYFSPSIKDADDPPTRQQNGRMEDRLYNQNFRGSNQSETVVRAEQKWEEASDEVDMVGGQFANFDISEKTTQKLRDSGINFLFPSQTSTYNPIYNGKDVIVQARTGSGKTLSYAIPVIERLLRTSSNLHARSPRLMVLTPTRELAYQVAGVISSLTDTLKVAAVYGGAPIARQEMLLKSGVDIIVGTPGRIADFLERRTLNLKELQHVILDEVDRMLDMGFVKDVDEILSHRYVHGKPDMNPQTLLFSATIPPWVQQMAQKYLRNDIVKLDLVGRGNMRTSTSVQHLAIQCTQENRARVIAETLQVYSGAHGRAIVFCAMKREADKLAASGDIRVESHVLHGDIPQEKRELVLKGFRDGRYQCLIATDVAARGLDIPEVDVVIQCSPPKDVDSYIHRSGRTGRAGRAGVSIVIYTQYERRDLYIVEKTAGIKFKQISQPTPETSAAALTEDAVKSLEKVSQSMVKRFAPIAEAVAAKHGAMNALASAIAVLSGCARSKSLLTSNSGFTTYLYEPARPVEEISTALESLMLPDEIKEKVTGLRLCADHKGCVFDLPSEYDDIVAKQIEDAASSESLSIPAKLPALKTSHTHFDDQSVRERRSNYYDRRPRQATHELYRRSRSSYQSRDTRSNNGSFGSQKGRFRSLSDEEY